MIVGIRCVPMRSVPLPVQRPWLRHHALIKASPSMHHRPAIRQRHVLLHGCEVVLQSCVRCERIVTSESLAGGVDALRCLVACEHLREVVAVNQVRSVAFFVLVPWKHMLLVLQMRGHVVSIFVNYRAHRLLVLLQAVQMGITWLAPHEILHFEGQGAVWCVEAALHCLIQWRNGR